MTIEVEATNGQVMEFPDGTPQADIQAAMSKHFGEPTNPPAPPEPPETPVADALESGMALPGELMDTAQGGIEAFQQRQAQGHQDPMAVTQRAISQAARTGGELMWDVGKVGADAWMATWGQLLPSALKDATKEGVKEFGAWIIDSPVAQKGWQALSKGAEYWEQFTTAYPEDAEQLGGMLDVSFMLSPRAPLAGAANKVSKTSLELKTAATQQEFDSVLDGSRKMLEPKSRRGAGKTTVEGWRGEIVYDPDVYHKEVIAEVAHTPGVDPQLTYTENYNSVDDHIETVARGLDDMIEEAGNPKVDRASIIGELQNLVEQLPDLDEALTLNADAQGVARKILRKAENLIKNSDGTAKGLLQVRRDLDEWITVMTQGAAFDATRANATTVATRMLRTTLNTSVSDAVPLVGVEDHLRQMHLLYKGRGILDEKAYDEGWTTIARMYQSIHRATGMSVPSTPLAQWATAGFTGATVASLAAAPVAGPTAAALLIGGGTVWGLKTYMKSPRAKRDVAKLLKATEHAIKTVQDPALVGQLRADRLLILGLMEE